MYDYIFVLFQICTFIHFDIFYIMVYLLCGPRLEWHDREMAIFMFYICWSSVDNMCDAVYDIHKHLQEVYIQDILGDGSGTVPAEPVPCDTHHTDTERHNSCCRYQPVRALHHVH